MKVAAATLALTLAVASRGDAQGRIETGFLDRTVEVSGNTYRYQIYVPAEYAPGTAVAGHPRSPRQRCAGDRRHVPDNRAERDTHSRRARAIPRTGGLSAGAARHSMDRRDHAGHGHGRARPDDPRVQGGSGANLPDRVFDGSRRRVRVGNAIAGTIRRPRHRRRSRRASRTRRTQGDAGTTGGAATESSSTRDQFSALAQRIKHLPMWVFHGATDESVSRRPVTEVDGRVEGAGVTRSLHRVPEHDPSERVGSCVCRSADDSVAAVAATAREVRVGFKEVPMRRLAVSLLAVFGSRPVFPAGLAAGQGRRRELHRSVRDSRLEVAGLGPSLSERGSHLGFAGGSLRGVTRAGLSGKPGHA